MARRGAQGRAVQRRGVLLVISVLCLGKKTPLVLYLCKKISCLFSVNMKNKPYYYGAMIAICVGTTAGPVDQMPYAICNTQSLSNSNNGDLVLAVSPHPCHDQS